MSNTTGIGLKVNGADYYGWLNQRAMRSIEQVCGSFDLSLTDVWEVNSQTRQIHIGDECQILVEGMSVLSGYIDFVEPSYDAFSHSLRVTGRDKTADLVDCSAEVDAYEFMDADLGTIASVLCEKFGIAVQTTTDLGQPFEKFVVQPGETAFQCIERAARQRGVLCTTDGCGNLVLCTRGTRKGDDLIEGENILAASRPMDARERFRVYKVNGQRPSFMAGADDPSEDEYGEAVDQNIQRYRPLIVNCECYADAGGALARAQFECCTRAGKSDRINVTVRGWRQSTGDLWEPNLLVTVRSPRLYASAVTMLVSAVCWAVGDNGAICQLQLTRPDAYMENVAGQVGTDPTDE